MTDKKTGRPRTGSIYWAKSGYRARVTVEKDGGTKQITVDLGTKDLSIARNKLKTRFWEKIPVEALKEEAARLETFQEAAERIVPESGIASRHARLDRLRRLVFAHLGKKAIDQIRGGDVKAVLKALADDGYSKQQCIHVRNDISSVLGELWSDDVIEENAAKKAKIPKHAKVDRRERTVLEDDELLLYLAWQHPDTGEQEAVLERQVMSCVSRIFGGLRWGDIRANRWEYWTIVAGEFVEGLATSRKTGEIQPLEVPEPLRPILRDWWERHGRPKTGLMFPVRRGERVGQERKPGSIARALRRDLARAFGIEAPVKVQIRRSNGRKDTRYRWRTVREATDRERALLFETEQTRPTDFHSFRRRFKQALADAGVDVQQSMKLSRSKDLAAHQRYLANTRKVLKIPTGALPQISIAHAVIAAEPGNENHESSQKEGCRSPDLNWGHHAYEARALTN
jgi:hypothetical protein